MEYDASCGVVIGNLFYVPSVPGFRGFNHERLLPFVKCFSTFTEMLFIFLSVSVVYHIFFLMYLDYSSLLFKELILTVTWLSFSRLDVCRIAWRASREQSSPVSLGQGRA